MDFQDSSDYKKIFKFSDSTGLKLLSRESGICEFKESFNWGAKDEYAKNATAFANNKGGYLVFGVTNKPRELKGLQSQNFVDMDEAKITEYFNSTFSPEIEFEKTVIKVRGKDIGLLRIEPSKQKPIIAIKNDGEIKEGEIYYRYNARTDKIKFPELRNLIDKIKETERKNWMQLFEKISEIGPENTALIDMISGKIQGKTGTLVIDQKLIPKLKFIQEGSFTETGAPTLKLVGEVKPVSLVVNRGKKIKAGMRFTEDPNAPAVRIKEEDVLKEFPLDYHSLTNALYLRYTDFRANKKYHERRKEIMKKGFFIVRKLNPHNVKSAQQTFYSERIFREFDKFYQKK